MASASILIPAKFISIILHVIIAGCIISNYEDNILSSNISRYSGTSTTESSDWTSAKQNVLGAMVTTEIFLFVEIVILFIGINMYCDKLNIIQTLAHSAGVILYSWYNLDSWKYDEIWSPWFFFSFCPMVVECYQAISSLLYYKKFKA